MRYLRTILLCVVFLAFLGSLYSSLGYSDDWLKKAQAGDADTTYKEAFKWCQLSVDQGDARAQFNLGLLP